MMERRRLLLMDNEYIKDGLVLWLDGINRGGVPGEWHDLISDNVCSLIGSYTEYNNRVWFAGQADTYGNFDSQIQIPYTDGTLEFVVEMTEVSSTGRPILAMGPNMMGGSIATAGNNANRPCIRWWCRSSYYQYWTMNGPDTNTQKKIIASSNINVCMCNGSTSGNINSVSSWSCNNDAKLLGYRGTGNAFKGWIYAVRLYNRLLTAAEMLHNQKIDNKRFNLGLNI